MKIRSLQNVLCVAMLTIFPAQYTSQAEVPVDENETVFAYRSFVNRGISGYLFPGGPWDIPNYVPVELIPVDSSAWANATIGTTLTFRVNRKVVGDVYPSASIDAKVTRVRAGNLRMLRGEMEPRVKEITVDGSIKFTLESTPRGRFDRLVKHVVTSPLRAVGIIAEIPLWVILAIGCSTGGCDL